ncbi:Rne/Rng family ribonuclease [PVC group bacterium]|nr:Rne/Rng family ribonuclease [PVC group bacterium]
MSEAIYIDGGENEIRVARLVNQKLDDLFVERPDVNHCTGNIYKGKVMSIVPGIQAAFVDIGIGKNGFLYVDEVIPSEGRQDISDEELNDVLEHSRTKRKNHSSNQNIKTLLKEGDEIVVQVTKDPIGTKGPRLTSYISIAGRYMVYMPNIRHRGVSRKITDRNEKKRLREIVKNLKSKNDCGLIARTVGEGKSNKDFERDLKYLERVWMLIHKEIEKSPSPYLLHSESNLLVRVLRDTLNEDVKQIFVESREHYRMVKEFLSNYGKELKTKLVYHKKGVSLFEEAKIEKEIDKLYRRKVWLKSGGYIVIEQTEALLSIDVNTGRYKGASDKLEETVLETNLESAEEIPRQLRLRNLGGIIIIDFIDMEKRKNRLLVYDRLDRCLKRDKAKTKIYQISKLGLIEMSRQRASKSLTSVAFQGCPYCAGEGTVKSGQSLGLDVIRGIRKAFSNRKILKVQLALNPESKRFIMKNFEREISQICHRFKKEVDIRGNKDLRLDEVTYQYHEKGKK